MTAWNFKLHDEPRPKFRIFVNGHHPACWLYQELYIHGVTRPSPRTVEITQECILESRCHIETGGKNYYEEFPINVVIDDTRFRAMLVHHDCLEQV